MQKEKMNPKQLLAELLSAPISEMSGCKRYTAIIARAVVSIFQGVLKNRIPVQASSLTYATLLATGPILAIVILFSTMFFRDKGNDFIYEKIMDAVVFVMPAFNEMSADALVADSSGETQQLDANGAPAQKKQKINPAVVEFINKILKGSASAGAVGMVAMLVTCLLLCINMESAFNSIWGVRKGRTWVNRIVFYFAMIFFGTIGSMFGMTFLATSRLTAMFGNIPLVSEYASWLTFVIGMFAMLCVLAFFYKYLPCANVRWKPAFLGALCTLLLLFANNKGSFLYISYIAKQQNFYGYFAIVAVAMFSLYIFWFVVLLGGQISNAIQYLGLSADDDSWSKLGGRTRAFLALAVFAQVAKAFETDGEFATNDSVARELKVSESLVKPAVELLREKSLICVAVSEKGDDSLKPNFSTDKITAGEFFNRIGYNSGDAVIRSRLLDEVKVVGTLAKTLATQESEGVFAKSIREII